MALTTKRSRIGGRTLGVSLAVLLGCGFAMRTAGASNGDSTPAAQATQGVKTGTHTAAEVAKTGAHVASTAVETGLRTAGSGAKTGGRTAGSAVKLGFRTAGEAIKTFGTATAGFFTGGPDKAKRKWNEGAARTKSV